MGYVSVNSFVDENGRAFNVGMTLKIKKLELKKIYMDTYFTNQDDIDFLSNKESKIEEILILKAGNGQITSVIFNLEISKKYSFNSEMFF